MAEIAMRLTEHGGRRTVLLPARIYHVASTLHRCESAVNEKRAVEKE